MDFNTIMQAIGSVGFPIAACIMCFWYIKDSNEKHKEEINKLSDALNNNTLALTKLCDKMESNGHE